MPHAYAPAPKGQARRYSSSMRPWMSSAASSRKSLAQPVQRAHRAQHARAQALDLARAHRAHGHRHERLDPRRIGAACRRALDKRSERPLVERHIYPAQQMQDRHEGACELGARRPGGHGVASRQAARQVVLARLGHGRKVCRHLLAHHRLGIKALVDAASRRDAAAFVDKDLAARHHGQKLLGNRQPLARRRRRAIEPGEGAQKRARLEHAHALAGKRRGLRAGEAQKRAGQRVVAPLQLGTPDIEDRCGQPDAKARPEIVVARQLVVEPQALRPRPHQADGRLSAHVGRQPGEQRRPEGLEVAARKLEPLHDAPSSHPARRAARDPAARRRSTFSDAPTLSARERAASR